jgi:uncharacterized protein YdhG (YjbR/CyaY superfamily)
MKPSPVEAYIENLPYSARSHMAALRACLKLAAPDALEELKWGKPALVKDGILFVFAAAKAHISLHPTPRVITQFKTALREFQTTENTIRFSLNAPLPKDLVMKIAEVRVYEKEVKGIGWR